MTTLLTNPNTNWPAVLTASPSHDCSVSDRAWQASHRSLASGHRGCREDTSLQLVSTISIAFFTLIKLLLCSTSCSTSLYESRKVGAVIHSVCSLPSNSARTATLFTRASWTGFCDAWQTLSTKCARLTLAQKASFCLRWDSLGRGTSSGFLLLNGLGASYENLVARGPSVWIPASIPPGLADHIRTPSLHLGNESFDEGVLERVPEFGRRRGPPASASSCSPD